MPAKFPGQQPVLTSRGDHYTTPKAEEFLGLSPDRADKALIRLHFRLTDGSLLDVPLSPQALAALGRQVGPLIRPADDPPVGAR